MSQRTRRGPGRPTLRPAALFAGLLTLLLMPAHARAQRNQPQVAGNVDDLLWTVVPGAERFAPKEGSPYPVFKAYQTDPATKKESLVGFAFLTSDMPPEEMGYSGPIQVLVGMDTKATITGVAVIDYRESLRSSRGDFLRNARFQSQFAGKTIADPFRVRTDIDAVSGATISSGAMARGIRNSARRVASSYLAGMNAKTVEPLHPGTVTAAKLEPLKWLEVEDAGLVQRINVLDKVVDGRSAIDLSVVFLRDESIATAVLGPELYRTTVEKLGERATRDHLLMIGIDGPLSVLYRATATWFIQDDDSLKLKQTDMVTLGQPKTGKVAGQFANLGVLAVDAAQIDAQRSFEILVDLRPGLGYGSGMFPGLTPPPVTRPTETVAAPTADSTAADSTAADSTPAEQTQADVEAQVVDALAAADLQDFDYAFEEGEDGSVLQRTLESTSWTRFGLVALMLAMAAAAFALKRPPVRWVTLAGTFVLLGFVVDGGFLSVSHITSAIKLGTTPFLNDLPLLLLVAFTVVTTLLWGRVFCGYLCPFGALQDFMEKVVPKRFRKELPQAVHDKAIWIKYAVLAVIVIPAVLGSETSIFQYFEPFGTVFFFSTSVVLWGIAAAILVAAAIVPRFYCRYMCPLGASLGVVSLVSPFRIKRVEQCSHCKVCENKCPTGAIRLDKVDFKECVRCNVCEVQLIEKTGVCKHDMEQIRPRLIQLKVASNAR